MSVAGELVEFVGLFKKHLNSVVKAEFRWVTAQEIDWDEKTMTANDSNGLPYYDVMLGLGSNYIKPKKGSDCLVSIVEGQDAIAFLLFADEVDQICFNGDIVFNNGEKGIPKLKELEDNLKSLKEYVEAINTALPIAFKAVLASTSANGTLGSESYSASMLGKVITLKDMENTKIKQ